MAQRNPSVSKVVPKLVVKIVGGKQVKRFIEEPEEATGGSEREDESPAEAVEETLKQITDQRDDETQSRTEFELWALKEASGRQCVTAPSGDRSRSNIHPKLPHRAEEAQRKQKKAEAELSLAVGEELSDWLLSSLISTEEEVEAVDSMLSGTINKSEIMQLFLKNDVPLKLPTFALLLQTFSAQNQPEQVDYRRLLQFIRRTAFTEERDVETNPQSPASKHSRSQINL